MQILDLDQDKATKEMENFHIYKTHQESMNLAKDYFKQR